MASSEPTEITGVVPQGSSNVTSSNFTEITPLLKSSAIRQHTGSLLKKLRESVVIKSKAANMILIWSALAYLIYGSTLNPEDVFVAPIREVYRMLINNYDRGATTNLIDAKGGLIGFMNMIGSGMYAFIGAWLLFYPLAGYLADIRYGRYKVVTLGLKMIWFGILALVVIYLVLYYVGSDLIGDNWINNFFYGFWQDNNLLVVFGATLTGVIIVTYLIVSIGFAAFAANVIQFGIDQLQDLPAKSSFLFIQWHLLTLYTGVAMGKLVWSTFIITITIASLETALGYLLLGIVFILFILAVPLSLCIARLKWFTINTHIGNPYREVAQIVGFARMHKVPIRRSAFTYWEDDIPTGLDLGKSKYGGPFTTDQVESVKAFFGILSLLLSLGPFFTADIAASAFLPILKHHLNNWVPVWFQTDRNLNTLLYFMFANGGTLYPLFIIIMILIFLMFIYPFFQRYIPGILKRIGIGLCLVTVSLLCSLLLDTVGHILPSGQNATSVFNPGLIVNKTYMNDNYSFSYVQFVDAPPLQLSPYILIVQNFLIAAAYILIYGGVFEFICAQSPHSMKGVLIGIFFAVKGLFQLIGVLGILLPFSFWQTSPRAGLVYFLVNIVISVVGVVAFIVAAKRYQYRQRDDFCNIRKYIEEFYEKEVQHNREFKRLSINISQDVQHN